MSLPLRKKKCILTVCISVLVVVPNSATIKLGRVTHITTCSLFDSSVVSTIMIEIKDAN